MGWKDDTYVFLGALSRRHDKKETRKMFHVNVIQGGL
jgi:hypothetical protein